MNTNNFRREKKQEFEELLTYWRDIERWIKIAEQVNKRAVIPAINELRYAARQLYYGIMLFRKHKLSDGEKSSINKRIIIADQYLMNADHDVIDAIVGFYSKTIEVIDNEVGMSQVSTHFPKYHAFREMVFSAEQQISATRHDAAERKKAYRAIREGDLKELISDYKALREAEVQARFARETLLADLADSERGKQRMKLFNVICGIATLIALVFSVTVWWYDGSSVPISDDSEVAIEGDLMEGAPAPPDVPAIGTDETNN